MPILSSAEARAILRLDPDGAQPVLDMILPAVDDYLKTATGYDWAADTAVDSLAKMAASMLVVQWYENPAMIGSVDTMQYGITNVIEQLTAKKLPDVVE